MNDIAYRVEEVARTLGVGRTKVFDLIRAGELVSVKIGGSRRGSGLLGAGLPVSADLRGCVMAGGKRSNGEGSVYQRKDGMWTGAASVLTTTGHRKRVTVSATTESEAWKKLRKKIADSDAGIPVAAETWTLESYLKYWMTTVAAIKRPRTVEVYGMVVRRHLVPNLGTKKLHRLSAQDVRTFITRLRHDCRCCAEKTDANRPKDAQRCCAEGKCCKTVLSDQTVQQIHAVLRNALAHAMREEVVPRNVARLV